MSRSSKSVLACLVAIPLLLPGCAMLEGRTADAGAQAPATTALGSSGSPLVRASLEPFSLANCMKFDALPQECERTVKGW